jgi:rSAM/selenodomain-associated transferase 2
VTTGTIRLSVVIPALDEEAEIAAAIASAHRAGAEVIVVDGGSRDGTVDIARSCGATVIVAQRGRGPQMNAGAAIASGEVLLFLHADTELSPEAGSVVRDAFLAPAVEIATFGLRFRERRPVLRLYERCARIESGVTRFGDACIVVRAAVFREMGGFPPWEIFEDVEFLRRARRRTRVRTLPVSVRTSARRFLSGGIIRRQMWNGGLLILFLIGVPPHRLAALYRNYGPAKKPPRPIP